MGNCPYGGATNNFNYKMTKNGKRFHSLQHRSYDDAKDGSGADEGTKGKYDWVVWTYNCITLPNPNEPTSFWREDQNSVGWEYDGSQSAPDNQ